MKPCIRDMYNEYIELETMVRKAIMILNDIEIFEFERFWEHKYLESFDKDIKKLGISNKNIFYDGGKYYHRINNTPMLIPCDTNPRCFPKVPSEICISEKYKYNDLLGYIDEFLYYKDNEELHAYVSEPPLNYLYRMYFLEPCPDSELAFWLNLFVYSACFIIPREYKRKDPLTITFNAPDLSEIETYEDLYFSSLMCLFDIYH